MSSLHTNLPGEAGQDTAEAEEPVEDRVSVPDSGEDPYDDPDMTPPADGAAPSDSAFLQRLTRVGNWVRDLGVGLVGFAGMFSVAACAWFLSFLGLRKFAIEKMHVPAEMAWTVPIAIDVASFTASIVALGLSIKGENAFIARFIMIATTLGSAALNFSELNNPNDTTAAWAAAMMPVLAIVMAEMMIARARTMYDRARGIERQRITLLRWIFDPKGTWKLMKAYTLGQELPEEMRAAAEQVRAELEAEQARQAARGRKRKPQQKSSSRPQQPKPSTRPVPTPSTQPSTPAATAAPTSNPAAGSGQQGDTAATAAVVTTPRAEDSAEGDATVIDLGKRRVIDTFPEKQQQVILAYERLLQDGQQAPTMGEVDRAAGTNGYAKKVIPAYRRKLEEAQTEANAVNA